MRMISIQGTLISILACLLPLAVARAEDEESIKDLRNALVALAPDVNPGEAAALSLTTHVTARSLARQYGVTGDPAFHNFLINIGARQRGYCAHYARDIGIRLKELNLKTLVLHWGAYYAGTSEESNCLVATARNQPFDDGIVLDAWRKGGQLFWCPVKRDREFEMVRHFGARFGEHSSRMGIPGWKEDMQESAWLQEHPVIEKPRKVTAPKHRRRFAKSQ